MHIKKEEKEMKKKETYPAVKKKKSMSRGKRKELQFFDIL